MVLRLVGGGALLALSLSRYLGHDSGTMRARLVPPTALASCRIGLYLNAPEPELCILKQHSPLRDTSPLLELLLLDQ